MSGTIAVDASRLGFPGFTGEPLCPACMGGRLHPYVVTFELPATGVNYTGELVDSLSGWVAICVGNRRYLRDRARRLAEVGAPVPEEIEVQPCGFSMPLTPHVRQF